MPQSVVSLEILFYIESRYHGVDGSTMLVDPTNNALSLYLRQMPYTLAASDQNTSVLCMLVHFVSRTLMDYYTSIVLPVMLVI